MSLDNFLGAQMIEPDGEPVRNQDQGETRGPDLGGLLGALLGGGGAAKEHAGGTDLGGLLGAVLGGGTAGLGLDANSLAEQSGLPSSVMQAAIPLVIGALAQGHQQRATGTDPETSRGVNLASLAGDLIGGKPLSTQALDATGLPQQLAGRLGLDHNGAVAAIVAVLKALGILPARAGSGSHAKPKPRPTAGTAKPKPRPHATTAARPRPASHPAKPRPASGSAKPRRRSSSGG